MKLFVIGILSIATALVGYLIYKCTNEFDSASAFFMSTPIAGISIGIILSFSVRSIFPIIATLAASLLCLNYYQDHFERLNNGIWDESIYAPVATVIIASLAYIVFLAISLFIYALLRWHSKRNTAEQGAAANP